MAQRYFTLQEANDLVPWLREVWESLAPLQKKLDDLDKEVASLQSRIHVNGGRETENELDLKQRALKEAAESIQRHIQAIHERGIMVAKREAGTGGLPFHARWARGLSVLDYGRAGRPILARRERGLRRTAAFIKEFFGCLRSIQILARGSKT